MYKHKVTYRYRKADGNLSSVQEAFFNYEKEIFHDGPGEWKNIAANMVANQKGINRSQIQMDDLFRMHCLGKIQEPKQNSSTLVQDSRPQYEEPKRQTYSEYSSEPAIGSETVRFGSSKTSCTNCGRLHSRSKSKVVFMRGWDHDIPGRREYAEYWGGSDYFHKKIPCYFCDNQCLDTYVRVTKWEVIDANGKTRKENEADWEKERKEEELKARISDLKIEGHWFKAFWLEYRIPIIAVVAFAAIFALTSLLNESINTENIETDSIENVDTTTVIKDIKEPKKSKKDKVEESEEVMETPTEEVQKEPIPQEVNTDPNNELDPEYQ